MSDANAPPILIVEDEPYIALDLAMAVEDAAGRVVGPVGSATEALALLARGEVAGAILDVNLRDGDVVPVLDVLLERGIPLAIQTGAGLPSDFRQRYPALTVHTKPTSPASLIEEIAALIGGQ
ncbi:response regulator [Reyranella sp.]|uniref:response regulator n=1 Tax=Reyranella sp. TaxID=1929291 RepID=UPI0037839475